MASDDGQKLFDQIVDEHQARLERVAEKRGVSRLKRIYDESQAEVAAKLARLVSTRKGSTFTAHQTRAVLAQLTAGQQYVARRMTGELSDAASDIRHSTLRSLSKDLNRLDKKFGGSAPVLPIEDIARFYGVVGERSKSSLLRQKTSVDNYGVRIVSTVEKELGKSLLQGESQLETVDRVTKAIDGEWWQGERIVRTELAHAANSTVADGLKASREVMPDLMMQWRELVTDSGMPLDDRVGIDSMAMHGQLVVPGGLFRCPARAPDGQSVPDSLAGEGVEFPPNRPNDRAVLAPWRPGWGVFGWKWVGNRRVRMR